MAEFATSGEPPEKRYTVRQLLSTLGRETTHRKRSGDPRGLRFVATAVRQFLGVDVSALRHWEQGIRSPSAVVRRFLDEMNATPTTGGDGSKRRFGEPGGVLEKEAVTAQAASRCIPIEPTRAVIVRS